MQVAQRLYEGKTISGRGSVGLITYMRTDSTRVSEEALAAVRGYIGATFGADALPAEPRRFKQKKDAQDAHEAIRPTMMDLPARGGRGRRLGRRAEALPADLEPLRRLADDAVRLRRDDRRDRGGAGREPRRRPASAPAARS